MEREAKIFSVSRCQLTQSHESAVKAGADDFQCALWEPFKGLFFYNTTLLPKNWKLEVLRAVELEDGLIVYRNEYLASVDATAVSTQTHIQFMKVFFFFFLSSWKLHGGGAVAAFDFFST